ncbi:hypothetical protein GOODEAATRI_016965, partial [Goodea atripinnis]
YRRTRQWKVTNSVDSWGMAAGSQKDYVLEVSPTVLMKEDNPGIHYRFNPPVSRDPMSGFAWQYTSCRSCNGGLRTREVLCKRRISAMEEKVLDDSACTSSRPLFTEPCSNHSCPPDCGPGYRQRVVLCKSGESGDTLPDPKCPKHGRPTSRMRCNLQRCPPPLWVAGPWGEEDYFCINRVFVVQCSARCGLGQEMRSVQCLAHTGQPSNECLEHQRPAAMQQCKSKCDPNGAVCYEMFIVIHAPSGTRTFPIRLHN